MKPNPYRPVEVRHKRRDEFAPLGCFEFLLLFCVAPVSGLFFVTGLYFAFAGLLSFQGAEASHEDGVFGLIMASLAALPLILAAKIVHWGHRQWLPGESNSKDD